MSNNCCGNTYAIGIYIAISFVDTPIEPYIADFACLELKLIIELDGGQHVNRIDYDDQRSLFLEQRGFKVMRFWNNDVIDNTVGVLEAIRLAVLEITERVE